jgi:hypothetical protein
LRAKFVLLRAIRYLDPIPSRTRARGKQAMWQIFVIAGRAFAATQPKRAARRPERVTLDCFGAKSRLAMTMFRAGPLGAKVLCFFLSRKKTFLN